jgi:outer membrane immunogenic protein
MLVALGDPMLARRLFIAFTAWTIGSIAAGAADLPRKAPALAPVIAPSLWTGFYIGGNLGGAWTRADGRWDPIALVGAFGVNSTSGDFNQSGFIGGVQAGYNWQFATAWVAGIEGDWSWLSADGSFTAPWILTATGLPTGPGFFSTMNMDPKWLATLRGRIGYLIVPQALLYFTGGGAWAKIDYSGLATNSFDYTTTTSFSDISAGYVLGGGVEWLFSNHWMLRGEYLFYHFNSSKYVRVNFPPGPNFPSDYTWGDLDLNQVRVALSYKF